MGSKYCVPSCPSTVVTISMGTEEVCSTSLDCKSFAGYEFNENMKCKPICEISAYYT